MDQIIKEYLTSFEFGELQHFENLGIIPLLTPLNKTPEYLTLKEALEKRVLTITEVSREGSVPELKVKNKAKKPVLLLDGEELVGAKQNRVLNTTILLKEKSDTVIPVSCTEQGRWSYKSKELSDSGTVLTPKLRLIKAQTVSDSLEDSREYRSDQGTVWEGIHDISEEEKYCEWFEESSKEQTARTAAHCDLRAFGGDSCRDARGARIGRTGRRAGGLPD